MAGYPTHSWSDVVAAFRAFSAMGPPFGALADAVTHLAASPYARGLYPVQSMHTLLLFQHDRADRAQDAHLTLATDGSELVLTYHAGWRPDRPDARPTAVPVWTKRGPDGMALVERALHHLRWFVEYRAPAV